MRVLAIGDLHIPSRASRVPDKLAERLNREFDVVAATGDYTTEEVLSWVCSLGEKCIAVRGNMDYIDLPTYGSFTAGKLQVGVYHGTGVHPRGDPAKLSSIARKMRVNILVTGHTHRQGDVFYRGVLIVNPGSATGVWGGSAAYSIPSFTVIEIHGDDVIIEHVKLEEEVTTEVKSYRIEADPSSETSLEPDT